MPILNLYAAINIKVRNLNDSLLYNMIKEIKYFYMTLKITNYTAQIKTKTFKNIKT